MRGAGRKRAGAIDQTTVGCFSRASFGPPGRHGAARGPLKKGTPPARATGGDSTEARRIPAGHIRMVPSIRAPFLVGLYPGTCC